jgi:hypothetical protein
MAVNHASSQQLSPTLQKIHADMAENMVSPWEMIYKLVVFPSVHVPETNERIVKRLMKVLGAIGPSIQLTSPMRSLPDGLAVVLAVVLRQGLGRPFCGTRPLKSPNEPKIGCPKAWDGVWL